MERFAGVAKSEVFGVSFAEGNSKKELEEKLEVGLEVLGMKTTVQLDECNRDTAYSDD